MMEMLLQVYLICVQLLRAVKHMCITGGRSLTEMSAAFLVVSEPFDWHESM